MCHRVTALPTCIKNELPACASYSSQPPQCNKSVRFSQKRHIYLVGIQVVSLVHETIQSCSSNLAPRKLRVWCFWCGRYWCRCAGRRRRRRGQTRYLRIPSWRRRSTEFVLGCFFREVFQNRSWNRPLPLANM